MLRISRKRLNFVIAFLIISVCFVFAFFVHFDGLKRFRNSPEKDYDENDSDIVYVNPAAGDAAVDDDDEEFKIFGELSEKEVSVCHPF